MQHLPICALYSSFCCGPQLQRVEIVSHHGIQVFRCYELYYPCRGT